MAVISIGIEAFASAAEDLGTRELSREVPSSTSAAELWNMLMTEHPALKGLDATVAFAINNQLVDRATVLQDGDILAILPPVSGG